MFSILRTDGTNRPRSSLFFRRISAGGSDICGGSTRRRLAGGSLVPPAVGRTGTLGDSRRSDTATGGDPAAATDMSDRFRLDLPEGTPSPPAAGLLAAFKGSRRAGAATVTAAADDTGLSGSVKRSTDPEAASGAAASVATRVTAGAGSGLLGRPNWTGAEFGRVLESPRARSLDSTYIPNVSR